MTVTDADTAQRDWVGTLARTITDIEKARDQLTSVRSSLQDIESGLGSNYVLNASAGTTSLLIGALYREIEELKRSHGLARARLHGAKPLSYSPRGPGSGWFPCVICGSGGSHATAQPDLAAYVGTKENGEDVVALFDEFGMTAHLDYRAYEPSHTQVKIGTCYNHAEFLDRLCEATRFGFIDPEAIRLAIGDLVPTA